RDRTAGGHPGRPARGRGMPAGAAVLVREGAHEDEALRPRDLRKRPLSPQLEAVRAAQAVVVDAARPEVEPGVDRLEALRAEPRRQALHVGPRLPDPLARRVDEAGQDQLTAAVRGEAR